MTPPAIKESDHMMQMSVVWFAFDLDQIKFAKSTYKLTLATGHIHPSKAVSSSNRATVPLLTFHARNVKFSYLKVCLFKLTGL